MKNLFVIILMIMMLALTGCEAIADIFSAGFYTGLALVVAVAVLIVWLVGRKR